LTENTKELVFVIVFFKVLLVIHSLVPSFGELLKVVLPVQTLAARVVFGTTSQKDIRKYWVGEKD
jgi:hypothetical protein